ncbi:hypothetical protein FHS09_002858 [Microbulbifer rhizosphaerae]|uniref:Uncharacterized protein n=1 Tax=Microbulbifer rhizosphaerae TaxID=1562603 RepID=A0A7W4WD26_9GAMM|nr:hypothetical protein [Microbulbifer rhizosphaerae]
MSITNRFLAIVVASFCVITTAGAECRKAQVCDDYGRNCQVRQICDSTLDLPSIEVDPLKPLPSTDLKPLPSLELPPLGTTKCEYKQVNGHWQNVCS